MSLRIDGDPLFLLGNQRSGTTWITNVLNRSPAVMIFYEPFEKGLGAFPDFPEEPVYVERPSSALRTALGGQYAAMLDRQSRYFRRSRLTRYLAACACDALVRAGHCGLGVGLSRGRLKALEQLRVVNQWHGEYIRQHLTPKGASVRPFIKETRLHLKLGTLRTVFPDTRIALIMRHPYPVIRSTVKWFEQGRLQELQRKLTYFFDIYRSQRLPADLPAEVLEMGLEGDVENKLLAHWLIANETALDFCERHPESALVLTYEGLCRHPLHDFRRLFAFYGIEFDDISRRYAAASSSTRPSTEPGIVDTHRDSAIQFRNWLHEGLAEDPLYLRIRTYLPASRALAQVAAEYEIQPCR